MALILAGASGLVAMWLLPQPEPIKTTSKPAASERFTEDSGELATADGGDQAVLVRYSAPPPPEPAADELVAFCSLHVTKDRCFVLFSRGTCVLVNEPSNDPVADAVSLLQSCTDSSARFVPERTRDGGMIIGFKEPVFHRFSSDELDGLGPWLSQAAPNLLSPEETMTAGGDWMPPFHARVGLLARRRLLEDAAAPVAVRVVRAKTARTAANGN